MKPIDQLTDDELVVELAENIKKEGRAKADEEGIDRLKATHGQALAAAKQEQNALRQELRKREKARP